MCFFVYAASPLTLSEMRSMLTPQLTVDILSVADQQLMKAHHYDAQTVARILHGGCSCDLIRPRVADPGEDEAYHRRRFRELGYNRSQVLSALDVHRRSAGGRPRPPDYWPRVFAEFVIEHARNAGPTMYYCHFSHDGLRGDLALSTPPKVISDRDVTSVIDDWLPEGQPVLVEH